MKIKAQGADYDIQKMQLYENPLISVIIPVYNVKQYLRECLDSIVNQSYSNLEIIIVDDGSTDGSSDICEEYKRQYEKIVLVHKSNGGLSDARNLGIEIATGDYISFIDSDDYISLYFYEIVANEIMQNHVELIALKQPVKFWDGEDGHFGLARDKNDYEVQYENNIDALKMMFNLEIPTGAPFKVLRRDKMDSIRFPVGYIYEDIATTYKEFLCVDKVAIISGGLYAYRKRNGSIIRQKFSPIKLSIINVSKWVVEDIDKQCPKLSNEVRCRMFPTLYSVFLQVPYGDIENRKCLWNEIKKYRKNIMFNMRFVRKKDFFAAVLTYLGMDIPYFVGSKFGQRETIKK